jgi:hypothetical protein
MVDEAMSEPPKRNLRTMWLILAVCAAPVVLSFAFYFLQPLRTSANYGELLPTQAAPPLTGTRADGKPWAIEDERGRWVVRLRRAGRLRRALRRSPPCDAPGANDAGTRARARFACLARDRRRALRTVPGSSSIRTSSSVRADPRAVERLPRGAEAIYLVDPLGNQVLAWPGSPDIRGIARDLTRLLKASRIG